MKKLPLDVSSFELMINGGYQYVDKTKQIYDLLSTGSHFFFLSRPRRFGKSLLISTLKHLFQGNKLLFENLWIGKSDYEWTEYPVISLDFSTLDILSIEAFSNSLSKKLDSIARSYNIATISEQSVSLKLELLVEELSKKNKVVILIDEYDHPLLNNLDDIELAKQKRQIITQFFTVLKSLNHHLRALFLTGVTIIAKTSIFSGLNNLNDVSLKPIAADLLGYTEDEIITTLRPYIEAFAAKKKKSFTEVMYEMRNWYNGYRFSEAESKVYNPFSVLYYLHDMRLRNYWLESGTPSFLIKVLKKQYRYLDDLQEVELSSESLGSVEMDDIPIIALLFQTGYLTIAHFNETTNRYRLDYPNEEVRLSFKIYLLAAFSQTNIQNVENNLSKLRKALEENRVNEFCMIVQSLFATIPYQLHIGQEKYYHSLFQLLASLLSLEVNSEEATDKGRVDLVVKTSKFIYLFELKINSIPEKAIEQIMNKRYFEKYLLDGRILMLVGLCFNNHNEKLSLECGFKELEH